MDNLIRKFIPVAHEKINVSIPNVSTWISELTPTYASVIILSLIFTLIILIIGCIQLYYVWHYVSIEVIQVDLYWLVCCSPVASLSAFLGMLIPRAAAFLYAFGLVFIMLCLFIVVTLKCNLFGNRSKMCEYLIEHEKKIKLKAFPFCCCCSCLPTFEANEINIRRMEWLIFQSPLIRVFLEIINIVVYLELNSRDHVWFTISSLTGITSMLIASYGTYIIIPLGSERLNECKFNYIFRYIDIIQFVYSVQKFALEFAGSVDILKDGPTLPSSSKALFWTSFLIISEMFISIICLTYILHPSKNVMFDKYKCNSNTKFSQRRNYNNRSLKYQHAICNINKKNNNSSSNIPTPIQVLSPEYQDQEVESINESSLDQPEDFNQKKSNAHENEGFNTL
uniref:Organic solute transporter alpha-like protein 1 (inferred by orthology to a C. elegans protein) n=1 Tax=Strongyloides venezuelensis TaxID=75913 RepID=A0A0K0FJP7_STRVS